MDKFSIIPCEVVHSHVGFVGNFENKLTLLESEWTNTSLCNTSLCKTLYVGIILSIESVRTWGATSDASEKCDMLEQYDY